ncbi:hypothetical protein [Hymenobacter sp. BRD67]|uniref:hypothetical protein n=1 Tax=Hymenobacter sp. BRD67 TaxID=2675877 RepID=UPI001563598F|nr:hypothetical protein [Hymenobacter sp. BRD67]QKG52029.1 hypothetical protein GKZ67_04680 [Hymenobacter sp. BRD67]
MTNEPTLLASSLLIERHLEFLAGLPSAQQPYPAPRPTGAAGKTLPFRPWLGTDFRYTVVAR